MTRQQVLIYSIAASFSLTLHTEASGSADNRPLEERIGDKVRKCDLLDRSLIDDRIGRLERQLTLI
jgi:hypothetical protein